MFEVHVYKTLTNACFPYTMAVDVMISRIPVIRYGLSFRTGAPYISPPTLFTNRAK